ncbi:MFS transporter [Lysinibacter cavernae]|uniref:MFS family permease n=1 Tax=Lysinibacter cavernae TaxID=1640652 RepID=A0A7X5R0M7_9MICO|nr:MFS transporter [Lysinibacter cavernae]NIH53416.1 MFS family permease [Lysinibacter cavernae]
MTASQAPSTAAIAITTELSSPGIVSLQRRTIGILVAGQILAGLGFGASLSVGALLAAEISGDPAWSGMAATMTTLGAAILAYPLARLAGKKGRRISLSVGSLAAGLGVLIVITAATLGLFWMLLLGLAFMGTASAVQYQSRFAAADLATPKRRGRDLSLVVWSTTVGSVIGPNLLSPGEVLGAALGMPHLTGVFVLTLTTQTLVTLLYFFALRPDPLLTSQRVALTAAQKRTERHAAEAKAASEAEARGEVPAASTAPVVESAVQLAARRGRQRAAIAIMALSHAVMVSVMAMTPVHLTSHGAALEVVGLTISLHIAGMFIMAPVFGILSDKWGAPLVVLLGAGILVLSLVLTSTSGESHLAVQVGLILLGLGWSAATVAGATLLTQNAGLGDGTKRQGVSDTIMNASGALAAASAGLVLGAIGFSGLSVVSMGLVAAIAIIAFLVIKPGVRAA